MKSLWALLLLITAVISAQEFETDIEGETSEEFIELLERLEENPLDVNSAARDELLSIPYIDEKIVDDIIIEREKRGGFVNKESLKNLIPDILFTKIERYIRVEAPRVVGEVLPAPQTRLRVRMERKRPFDEDAPGNPLKFYTRTLIDHGRFRGCFLTEKDAGEKYYTDFIVLGLEFKKIGLLENLILGYYGLDFGERLVLGSPVLTFKGYPYSTRRKGIFLYTITGENTYKRGVALQSRNFGPFSLSLFYSYATLDAGDGDSIYYTYSADHTTSASVEKKDRAKEMLYGGHLSFSRDFGYLGLTYYRSSDYDKEGEEVRSYSPLSANLCLKSNRLALFGEIAYSTDIAALCGVKVKSDRFIWDVVYRYLPMSFFSPHSSPFSDKRISSYGVLNDKGVYSSITYRPLPKTELIIYGDHMEWEDDPLPGKGNEYRIIAKRRIRNEFEALASYKYKSKQDDIARFFRFDLDIDPLKEIGLRLRAEWAMENDSLCGQLVFGDLSIRPFAELSLNFRYIIFDSDLSRFRFTEYEAGLPGVMGNTFITGHGKRGYFVIRYRPIRALQLSLKYEETLDTSAKFSGQVDMNFR